MVQSALVDTITGRVLPGGVSEGSRLMADFVVTSGGYVLPGAGSTPDAGQLTALGSVGQVIWLNVDPFYNTRRLGQLGALLEAASTLGLRIVPVLGQFSPASQPVCYRQPAVLDMAAARATAIVRDYGAVPCLHVFTDRPALHFAPSLAPAPLTGCTCAACAADFAGYAADRGFDPPAALPVGAHNPGLGQIWQDFQAEALPAFTLRLMQTTRGTVPLWLAR